MAVSELSPLSSLFSEDILKGDLAMGEFTSAPHATDLQVRITDSTESILYQKMGVGEGKFAFTANVGGAHKICITNPSKYCTLCLSTI